nr:deleted in malignant brain tumors 1 protein-like [Lytechinus pictus]
MFHHAGMLQEKSSPPTQVNLNNEELRAANEIKVLGVIIQGNLKWDAYIRDIVSRANRRMFMHPSTEPSTVVPHPIIALTPPNLAPLHRTFDCGTPSYHCLNSTQPSTPPLNISQPLWTRLVGGSASFEGRVEVYYQNAWNTVCDDSWNLNDAHVVCHTLGYPRASTYRTGAYFGEGTGDIILDNVQCTGSESNIAFCQHNGYYNENCGHHEDAGVVCEGIVSAYLTGGSSSREGTVKVLYQTSYGTVCDDSFGSTDADVVCRMLGYTFAESFSCCAAFGEGSGDIVVDDLQCTGDEVTIGHCDQRPFGDHNCGHIEDAGVTCIRRKNNNVITDVDGNDD